MRTPLEFLACCCILLLCSPITVLAQPKLQQHAIVLKRMIELNHYSPRPVDDQFSKDLFDHFIDDLDPEKLFLTRADIESLSKYRTLLDEELQNKNWQFFNAVLSVYKRRLQHVDSLVIQHTAKPFDFVTPDKIPAGFDTVRALNDADLKSRWGKLLKYQVLQDMAKLAAMQLKKTGAIRKADILLKEPELRSKVGARNRQKIKSELGKDGELEQSSAETFLSTIAKSFDPHTDYFDLKAKRDFQTELNTDGYYFGFGLAENDRNEVVISSLMPGSAAWKSGQLNKDDVVLQLQWEGQEPIDVSAASIEEVNAWIDESKTPKLHLTVRKLNGLVSTVSLQKEKIDNEEQCVKSFLLAGKNKIGYIYLPGFYTSWEEESGSSCAADVAKEIVKLKKDGIEGIILDVRFNGGGSLQEAIELAGIFIDEGPVCQLKSNKEKVATLKDVNRGTIWDGPLLMLVNGQSASASELVAAVLQDYNRAIIAGSVTHGKGTGQEIIPIDTTGNNSTHAGYGFIKITSKKLYRVTGRSVQAKGVEPDILLPDVLANDAWHEASLPFSLKPDTIKPNTYYRPLAPMSLSSIKQLSAGRVAAGSGFRKLAEWQKRNLAHASGAVVSLKWEDMENSLLAAGRISQEEKFFTQSTSLYKVGYSSFNKAATQATSFANQINAFWEERLSKDIYVEECFAILTDFIQAK